MCDSVIIIIPFTFILICCGSRDEELVSVNVLEKFNDVNYHWHLLESSG